MNIKAGHDFEQRHLEAKFGQFKFSEPRPWWDKTDVEFFYPNFSVELGIKTKTNYKAHDNTSRAT
jgi:hypothetical protein